MARVDSFVCVSVLFVAEVRGTEGEQPARCREVVAIEVRHGVRRVPQHPARGVARHALLIHARGKAVPQAVETDNPAFVIVKTDGIEQGGEVPPRLNRYFSARKPFPQDKFIHARDLRQAAQQLRVKRNLDRTPEARRLARHDHRVHCVDVTPPERRHLLFPEPRVPADQERCLPRIHCGAVQPDELLLRDRALVLAVVLPPRNQIDRNPCASA